jgi:hypothetical protein
VNHDDGEMHRFGTGQIDAPLGVARVLIDAVAPFATT